MNQRQIKKKERFRIIRLLEKAAQRNMCVWVHYGDNFALMDILSMERDRCSCRAESPEYVIVCRPAV